MQQLLLKYQHITIIGWVISHPIIQLDCIYFYIWDQQKTPRDIFRNPNTNFYNMINLESFLFFASQT